MRTVPALRIRLMGALFVEEIKLSDAEMLAKAMDLARRYYDERGFQHAEAVYALLDGKDPHIRVIGLFHDLLEDTECSEKEIDSIAGAAGLASVKMLTFDKSKPVDESRRKAIIDRNHWAEIGIWQDDLVRYYTYVEDIVNSGDKTAFEVKRADMLDHLSRKATLNDWLRTKYRPVLSLLKIDEQI